MSAASERGITIPQPSGRRSEIRFPVDRFTIPHIPGARFPRFEGAPRREVKAEIPLAFIPGPELRGKRDFARENTSGHELNHVLAAMGSDFSTVWLSVNRVGKSLGRTTFAGDTQLDKFKVVMAAGSVATHDGCACGYQHDMSRVQLLSDYYGGISPSEAQQLARNIVEQTPRDVREKAAEIISYLREVPGDWIPLILKRAQLEVEGKIPADFTGYGDRPDSILDMTKGRFSQIEHVVGGAYIIRYFVDGKKKRERMLCGLCHVVNGHQQDCPGAQNHPEKIADMDEGETKRREKEISSDNPSGDIFRKEAA